MHTLAFIRNRRRGLSLVGVVLPVGRITRRSDASTGRCGRALWQRYAAVDGVAEYSLISDIRNEDLPAVKLAVEGAGLAWSTTNVRSGFGRLHRECRLPFAASDTKGHALRLAEYLKSHVTLDQLVNIHLTGCPHSCAQHYIGDIGLLATKVEMGDEIVEGYHVFVGGGYGDNREIGRLFLRASCSTTCCRWLKPCCWAGNRGGRLPRRLLLIGRACFPR